MILPLSGTVSEELHSKGDFHDRCGAERSFRHVDRLPDISPGDDTFLAADMRSPLISCECSASAHGFSFLHWL